MPLEAFRALPTAHSLLFGVDVSGNPIKLFVSPDGSLSTAQLAGEDLTHNVLRVEEQFNYKTVAASQTALVLGAVGAVGDLLSSIAISASTGTITVLDGAVSVLVIPVGAVGVWLLNLVSVSGAWKITTAAATSCTAIGRFT